ncbi:hypothetical protein DFQ26_009477 [Actinomortierella ambigua]|nr:hypothetical protein DFQ26_009477 [Actinomortierella ambigua]
MEHSTAPRGHDHDHCTHKTIAITSCDSWFGYYLAEYLAGKLKYKHKGKDIQLLCLAVNTDRLRHLKHHKNVQVRKIEYTEESLADAFRKVDCTILIPELDEMRVEEAKKVIDAMRQHDVKCSMLLSSLGADTKDLPELYKFRDIEKELKDKVPCHLVLRSAFVDQLFFLWRTVIQQKGELPMSVDKDSAMSPLDMRDIFCAVDTIVAAFGNGHHHHHHPHHHHHHPHHHHHHHHDVGGDHHDVDGDHHGCDPATCFGKHTGMTYSLTGPEAVTAEKIAQTLGEVIDSDIQFKSVSRDEMKQYLESLRKQQAEGLQPAAMFDVPVSAESLEGRQEDHTDHLSDTMIAVVLDELELIKKGEANVVTDDLMTITGHHGRTVRGFFEEEKKCFQRQLL